MVSSNTVYGGTYALLNDFLPAKCNVSTTMLDVTDLDAVEAAMKDNTRVFGVIARSNASR